ncbi:MAG: AraC family transcriptional regulator [Pseudomonadota bacterium]
MLHPPATVPIAMVHGMLSGVKARKQPYDAFLADAGIAPELLEQAGARVTADQYVALFRLLIERLDDDFIGFLSRPFKHGGFAMMVRAGVSAPTLEVAIRRIAHTLRLLQDDVLLEPVREGALAGLALRFTDPSREWPVFLHELLLRVIWRLLTWLAGKRLPAARFDFAFESPPHAASYAKIFPGPLQFGMQHSAVWFDVARLQDPVRRDEAAMRTFLPDAPAHVILPRRGDEEASARVRAHLQRTQPEWPDLVATAEAMHMAASTLQRRLASEGTSFQALKDELRRDTAIVRLNTSAVPLAALACELGFADSAAFQRAFKGWTGSAPGAYRRGGA